MLYNARGQKLQVGDMQVDCITFGRGKKPLVMIQGLNTRGITGLALPLAWTYRLFAKEFQVYIFDRRPIVHEGITVKDMAGDIADAMDTLGITDAAVLGVSQGGMIAQHLAIARPDLVSRLVLAVTLCRNNDAVISSIHRWAEMAERGEMKALVADMAESMYTPRYLKRYRFFLPLLTILQTPKDVERFSILAVHGSEANEIKSAVRANDACLLRNTEYLCEVKVLTFVYYVYIVIRFEVLLSFNDRSKVGSCI